MRPPNYEQAEYPTGPHQFRLPVTAPAQELHDRLADVPGFRGVTVREDVAYATFAAAPPLGVAKQVVRRLAR